MPFKHRIAKESKYQIKMLNINKLQHKKHTESLKNLIYPPKFMEIQQANSISFGGF